MADLNVHRWRAQEALSVALKEVGRALFLLPDAEEGGESPRVLLDEAARLIDLVRNQMLSEIPEGARLRFRTTGSHPAEEAITAALQRLEWESCEPVCAFCGEPIDSPTIPFEVVPGYPRPALRHIPRCPRDIERYPRPDFIPETPGEPLE